MRSAPQVTVARRSEQHDPVDARRVARLLAEGAWVRVTAGAYVTATEWTALSTMERHRLKVDEVLRRTRGPVVVSHLAAAAVHGADVLGAWPYQVDVTIDRASGGRTGGALRRHALGLDDVDLVPYGRHHVTTPAQTALDIARTLPFARAVGVIDQLLWEERLAGPLTTLDELADRLARDPFRRGDVRAARAFAFASPLAANVRESDMRVLLDRLGFPPPRLQERRVLPSGRLVYGDMYFPEHDHWLEIDGRGKYTSPEFGQERDPSSIVIDEKNRENEIRREVRGFSRLEALDSSRPRYVYDVLVADGLPSRKPRP